MKRHFLQSERWMKYEESQGKKVVRLKGEGYEVAAIVEKTPMGNYLYCPYGPTLEMGENGEETEESFRNALRALREVAKGLGAFFVRLEPTIDLERENGAFGRLLEQNGLKKSKDLDPAHTWILDLSQPEEELLKGMRKSNVQYWRSSRNKGLKVWMTQDPGKIGILTGLLTGVGNRNHFNPHSEEHLRGQLEAGFATLYVAEFKGEILAAALVYDDADTRFYAHAAASDRERKLAAGTVLLVQMILDAKAAGKQYFDFWGITTSEDKAHPWYGFSQYKRSFGGGLVSYAGTWDLPIRRGRYVGYLVLRILNRWGRARSLRRGTRN